MIGHHCSVPVINNYNVLTVYCMDTITECIETNVHEETVTTRTIQTWISISHNDSYIYIFKGTVQMLTNKNKEFVTDF